MLACKLRHQQSNVIWEASGTGSWWCSNHQQMLPLSWDQSLQPNQPTEISQNSGWREKLHSQAQVSAERWDCSWWLSTTFSTFPLYSFSTLLLHIGRCMELHPSASAITGLVMSRVKPGHNGTHHHSWEGANTKGKAVRSNFRHWRWAGKLSPVLYARAQGGRLNHFCWAGLRGLPKCSYSLGEV